MRCRRRGGEPNAPPGAYVGAMTGAVFVLARGAIRDWPTALIVVVSLTALVWFKVPEPVLVGAAGIVGLFIYKG